MDEPIKQMRAMARTKAIRKLEQKIKELELDNANLRGRIAVYETMITQFTNKELNNGHS